MTAAWIIWRTDDAVRNVWDAFLRQVRQWRGPIEQHLPAPIEFSQKLASANLDFQEYTKTQLYTGYVIETPKLLTVFDVLAKSEHNQCDDKVIAMHAIATQRALWNALQSDALIAYGIPIIGAGRRAIASIEWIDLDHFDRADWSHDSIGSGWGQKLAFTKVRVRCDAVRTLWPRLNQPSEPLQDRPQTTERGRKADILNAYAACFPDGVPAGTMVQMRNRAILEWLKTHDLPPVSEKTIQRILRIYPV